MAYTLEVSPYKLQSKRQLNRFGSTNVAGYLLKFTFADSSIGYSSIQSWEALGDKSVTEELLALSKQRPLTLGARSLEFASIDAQARQTKQKLYSNLNVENHFTLGVPEVCDIPTCFTHVKIKLGIEDLKTFKEHEWLKNYKLRVDFNLGLTLKDYDALNEALRGFEIDFLEDPGFMVKHTTVFYDEIKPANENWVIKPAKEVATETNGRILFTSYMDHPINQVHATIVASQYYQTKPKEICGLRTDLLFTDNPYLEYFATDTNMVKLKDDGYGIGFTTLLEKEKWQIFRG